MNRLNSVIKTVTSKMVHVVALLLGHGTRLASANQSAIH
jgi:hypothetical protein